MKKIVILGVIIIALIALVVYAYVRPGKTAGGPGGERAQMSIPVEVAKVEKGNISQIIFATGAIEARAEVDIYPKQTGELTELNIEEGARVREGQTLAKIEANTFVIQTKQALADLESAKAAFDKNSSLAFVSSESNFKQAKSSVDRLEAALKQAGLDLQLQEKQSEIQIKKADADLRIAQARLEAALTGAREQELEQAKVRTENAKRNLDRMTSLLESAMISQDQVESAQLQYDINKAQLSLLEEGARPEDIVVLKAQVEVAKASMQSAESNNDLIAIKKASLEAAKAQVDSAQAIFDQAAVAKDASTWEKDLAQAKASVQKAEAALEMAKQKVDDSIIKAPISGIITKRYMNKGDAASPNRPFATIVDMEVVKVKAKIPARDVSYINPNHQAIIKPDDQPGKTYQGKVTLISPVIDRASQTCEIEIEVSNSERKIRPGAFTRIEIAVAEYRDVPIIPIDVITKEGEDNFVYVIKEGIAVKNSIITGINDSIKVEILSGLEAGQEYIIAGQSTLRNGMSVTVSGKEPKPGKGPQEGGAK